jgi:hypothetical protein
MLSYAEPPYNDKTYESDYPISPIWTVISDETFVLAVLVTSSSRSQAESLWLDIELCVLGSQLCNSFQDTGLRCRVFHSCGEEPYNNGHKRNRFAFCR